jgi:hypothetical protein
MIAFFTITEKQLEALVCTLVFVLSIFYIVTTYPNVNSTNLFEDEENKFNCESLSELRMIEIINNWR